MSLERALPPVTPKGPFLSSRKDRRDYAFTVRGGRRLTLSLYNTATPDKSNFANSHISNLREHTKEPGSTTALYVAAKTVIQTEADSLGAGIRYSLDTSSPAIKAWALSTGAEIFHWDTIPSEPLPDVLRLQTTIYPGTV